MEYILPAALILLVVLSRPLYEKFFSKKDPSEELIKNPWFQIHAIPGYAASRHIAALYPKKGEPNILPILEQICEEGRLLLPRCTSSTTMEFYPIKNLRKDLVIGNYGIMEPREGIEPYTDQIHVFLVPGTKFNLDGKRQGHGKGYYDRYLASFKDAYKAGIATPKQIAAEPLEQKATDIPMDQIIVCRERY